MQKNIIIIGAGASGLAAAVAAARCGAQVLLIEQKNSVGKKILATGNGRCNYTNFKMNTECFHSETDSGLIQSVLEQYPTEKILDFFKTLGVYPWERDGYIYPASMQASTMVHVFEQELCHLDAKIYTDEKVSSIRKKEGQFIVRTSKGQYSADSVILAAGGKASPALGSDGSGYALASDLGHHIVTPVPALCGLKCQGRFFKAISGVRTHGSVTLYVDDQKAACDTGELQMTAYGISGIPVFQVSRYAARALQIGKKVTAEIDFMPVWSETDLFKFLAERRQTLSYKTAMQFMEGLLNEKLIPLLLKASAIDETLSVKHLDDNLLQKLCQRLKHFRMNVSAVNGFESAQVCAGGIDTKEIDIHTMASKCCDGLYLAGELLDVDGMCGGYNLHFAWATGLMAGVSAAQNRGGRR